MTGSRGLLLAAALVALFGSAATAAENTIVTLAFGGDPGSPLAHAYSYGLPETDNPRYTLRIPVIDQKIKTVFYDTELTISNPAKIVQGVRASRAYATLADCDKARGLLNVKLIEAFPRDYAGTDGAWQRQSADGKVAARAVCESPRHYPMPVLRFELTLLAVR